MTAAAGESSGTSQPATVVATSSTAGSRAVRMLTAVPGSSDSGSGLASIPANGLAAMPASVRPKIGPASTSDGTAITIP